MKKFTNQTHELRSVSFKDGTTQFLMRGESFESDKVTKRVQTGVRVTDARKVKRQPKVTDDQAE